MVAVFSSPAQQAAAQDAGEAFEIDAVQTTTPPNIDGTIDDPAWQKAVHVRLTWDHNFQRPATDRTDAYLLVDSQHFYVAFVTEQAAPITATQQTNDVGLSTDDVVRVYFWPSGEQGFEYFFVANPIGTRFQISSENAAFAPRWTAVAKRTQSGYIVTEKIPVNVMRGDGRSTWRVQFDRRVRATGQLYEWAHAPAQGDTDSVIYAGYLRGMKVAAANMRTKPRLALYALGDAASSSAGGSTSRVGGDIAVPITPTASFLGTFHPDYSNVELDQQSIAPTAFQRMFQEVRPFFTQGANFYNGFNCNDCVDFPLLYTPAIPTPRDGFAVEGTQGRFSFGTFDAIGASRNDQAQSVLWRSTDRRYRAEYQRQAVTFPGTSDVAQFFQLVAGNPHDFNGYVLVGGERGTNVTDPALGYTREYGINLFTPKSGVFAAYHEVGAQYAPIDGFNTLQDVSGPTLYAYREYDNDPRSYIQSVNVSQDFQRFRNRFGVLNARNDQSSVSITTRTLLNLSLSSGSQYLLLSNGTGAMIDQNGVSLSYAGLTSTPTKYSYDIGRFGPGYLRSTFRSTTLKLGPRNFLTLEADNTNYGSDAGAKLVQWLERGSFAYQIDRDTSIAFGARRIIGTSPPLMKVQPAVDSSNVSFAFHRRFGASEAYLVYGDPNALATTPALILKIVRYFGAEKGT